jgi:DNA-directed RNA polymerase I, II, and III subunit RPABC2
MNLATKPIIKSNEDIEGSETGGSETGGSETGSDIGSETGSDIGSEIGSEVDIEDTLNAAVSHPASFPLETLLKKQVQDEEDEDEDDDEDKDDDGVNYLKKFDINFRDEFVKKYHPESNVHNYEQVKLLTIVTLDEHNKEQINDENHRTLPFLTKYEKTRVLGQRAIQINSGARPLIDNIPANVIDGYTIATLELRQKKIPFIIKRPLPNGECEYWKLSDLELID